MRPKLLPLLLAAALAACGNDPTGPSEITPSIQFVKLAWQVGLSPDGRIAALEDPSSSTGDLYFYHTETAQLEFATQVGDPLYNFASGMSADGAISALHGMPVEAGLWTKAGGWTDIASAYPVGCNDDIASGWDVSDNGRTMVGLVWHGCIPEAFRWDAVGAGVMTPLQRLGSPYAGDTMPPPNRATVVSGDGKIAAGWAQVADFDRWAALWNADGTGQLLSGLPQNSPSEVLSITPDGSMVAGTYGVDAFYWTAVTGMVDIGYLAGADDPSYAFTYPNAIAANGKLIFGESGSAWFTLPRPFVWTKKDGMRPLADILTAQGITLPDGYYLTNILNASRDGTVLLGSAWDDKGMTVTFVLRLPVSAYGL